MEAEHSRRDNEDQKSEHSRSGRRSNRESGDRFKPNRQIYIGYLPFNVRSREL